MMLLKDAARNALIKCMGLKKTESCLILFDVPMKELAEAFYKEAKKITGNAKLLEMPALEQHGQEPPAEISEEMKKHDVVMIVTSKSLSHTEARRDACKMGARIASMPGLTGGMMERALAVDYKKVKSLTSRLAKLLNSTKTIKIRTKNGTDLVIEANPGTADEDNGLMLGKGDFGNLPAGEAGLAPKTAEGVAVVDGAMAGIGIVRRPFRIVFRDGYAVEIENKKLRELLESCRDKSVFHIGEFAMGCNPAAEISGNVLEDEKVMGTCHIALGDNTSYKGGKIKAPVHLDGIIKSPTIFFDGMKVMEKGKLLAPADRKRKN